MSEESLISTEARGAVWLIGLNRPQKKNAFNAAMLRAFAEAYTAYEADPALRCALVFAHGSDFTAGLDLADVAPRVLADEDIIAPDGVDPWGLYARERAKPVVVAVQGRCLTLGIELMLASDIRLAAEGTSFAQIEIARGIFPFGGATIRGIEQLGWGNAMHFMLTADTIDAAHALRIGLVQEVVAPGALMTRALAVAERVAAQSPLGVRATIANARKAMREGQAAAVADLRPEIRRLMGTADAQEGLRSLMERRPAVFQGR
jgi:enoyl-CoA hydratase/carnithine racemase